MSAATPPTLGASGSSLATGTSELQQTAYATAMSNPLAASHGEIPHTTFQSDMSSSMIYPSSDLAGTDLDSSAWKKWYPSWHSWKFRRTLAYWISVFYIEGSLLFIAGGASSLLDQTRSGPDHARFEEGLVSFVYFIGGIFFTLGAYCGVLEVANIATKENQRASLGCFSVSETMAKGLSLNSIVAFVLYFIGALCYNVNAVTGHLFSDKTIKLYVTDLSAIIGAVCFTVGGAIEVVKNECWRCKINAEWVASVGNTVGGVLFVVSAVTFAIEPESEQATLLYGDWSDIVGSAGFAIGGVACLWLWKKEAYGLVLLPELNVVRHVEPSEREVSVHAEYGCGRASGWQLPWLMMYLLSATVSVMDAGLTLEALYGEGSQEVRNAELIAAILNIMLSHGVLLLGSVIHHLPTARPHNWLLMYMRATLWGYFVLNCLKFGAHFQGRA